MHKWFQNIRFPLNGAFPSQIFSTPSGKKIYVGLKKRFGGVKWYGHPL